ncbi:MAG: DUF3795 domain-containing protein [Clostridia bacterium]|nr:DUF3795 domain-containing protein [Clostridia bacterium]
MIESRCGILCSACEFVEKCGCGTCIVTNGNPFYGECRLAKCCQERNCLHCGECSEFPCELLKSFSNDPENGDNPKGARIEQCKIWKAE